MISGGDRQRQALGLTCYRWAWLSLASGALAACGAVHAAGMGITPAPLFAFLLLVAVLLTAHHFYTSRRPDPRLALITGAVGLMIASAVLAGIIANVALRLRFPLMDDRLAAADQLLGVDTPALVVWTAERPWAARILGWAYSSIFPLAFFSAIWLGFRADTQRVWELVLGFGASIQVAALVSVFTPALGNIVHAGLQGLAGQGLPAGAGIYHLHAIAAYRDGTTPLLDARHLEGVVTFPSFHMVMAIVVAWAARRTGLFGWLAAAWSALVAISTVPIGGHYVVDLLAGALLWAGVMMLGQMPLPWWGRRGAGIANAPASAV